MELSREAVLSIKDLRMKYGENYVLRGIDSRYTGAKLSVTSVRTEPARVPL